MWASHGDYKAERDELHVEPFVVRRETPRPEFYLSAAPAPYNPYDELTDPALVGYYARPRRRKILLQHGIIHPRDYQKIFGAENRQRQSTHDTLMRVNRLLKSRMKEPKAERDLLPYLPDAMKRLLRAGLKMEDKAVEAAKNEMMSRPLDYVIIRLEEQLRAVKHALYLQKQPTIAKNMEKFGFTGFVHNGKEDDPELPAKVAALEREVGAVQRWEVRVHKATEDHLKATKTERMMAKSDYDAQHHIHQDAPPASQKEAKAGEAQKKQRPAKAETQTAKSKGVATDKDEKEAQTTEKVETADKQHQGKEVKPTPRPPFMIKTTKKQKDRVASVKKNKEKAKAKEWQRPPQKKIEGTPFWLRTKEEKRPKSAPATSASKAKTDPPAEGEAANQQRSNVDATAGEGNPGVEAEPHTNASQYQLTPAASRSDQKDGNSNGGQSSSTAKGVTSTKGGSTKSKKAGKKGASTEKSNSKKRKRPKSKKVPSSAAQSAVSVAPTTEQKTSGKHLLAEDEVPNTTREAMASDMTAFGKLSPPQTISDVGFDLPPDDPDQARSPPIPVDETQMRLEHEDAQYNPQSMRTSLHPEVTETLDAAHPNEPKELDPLEPPQTIEQVPSTVDETSPQPPASQPLPLPVSVPEMQAAPSLTALSAEQLTEVPPTGQHMEQPPAQPTPEATNVNPDDAETNRELPLLDHNPA